MELLAAAAVFFLYPVLSMSGNGFRAAQILMRRELAAFVETICAHGYLTREGYEECLNQASGMLSEVRIEIRIRRAASEGTEEIPFSEIEEELFQNGSAKFRTGDYITVVLTGKPAGMAGISFPDVAAAGFRAESGGRIRDEIESLCVDLSEHRARLSADWRTEAYGARSGRVRIYENERRGGTGGRRGAVQAGFRRQRGKSGTEEGKGGGGILSFAMVGTGDSG